MESSGYVMHLTSERRNQCLLHCWPLFQAYTFSRIPCLSPYHAWSLLLHHIYICVSSSLLQINLPKNNRAHPPPTLWQGKELVPHLYALYTSLPPTLLRIDYSWQYRQLQGTKHNEIQASILCPGTKSHFSAQDIGTPGKFSGW